MLMLIFAFLVYDFLLFEAGPVSRENPFPFRPSVCGGTGNSRGKITPCTMKKAISIHTMGFVDRDSATSRTLYSKVSTT
jgi:hypothetical protein